MKLKNITAPNMPAALKEIKESLGNGAIIVSSETLRDGSVVVTAAIEDDFSINWDEKIPYNDSQIRAKLEYHCVVDVVKEKILARSRQVKATNDIERLVKTLQDLYRFEDILDLKNSIKTFVGITGSGKSTAIAKVATQAKLRKIKTCIISTDNVTAGGKTQLENFANILGIDFIPLKDNSRIGDYAKKYFLTLVDTPGINPFIAKELNHLKNLQGDIVMTLDAGKNSHEAVEIAECFYDLGARFYLPTRLDLTRRIGSILSVASCYNFKLCGASVSSSIATGLADITPKALTGIILA